ncbi:DUF1837 domain-containing protein [Gilliamella sp. Pas-s27]|uniref:HamA C-terminal domain-containing protein n=1 Tax=Gilliamella sp. Pas-s27 TaxID=2687311 RepID=UPI00136549AE|nr:DUF1837 domain-containing protein [Gilliamella sp. Pas-s27]MWP46312.1 DUF1837 domain-containing protein [Gilliamella sp. Pas-s27]
MDFQIIINDALINLCDNSNVHENDFILSIINDFENGKWRYSKFKHFIWNNIAETALSHKERESLANKSHSLLTSAAKNLRLTKTNNYGEGGELAEILLYGIMKEHYGALPVVPKIFYKQNAQDFAKGSDSVHIVIESNENFSLWFGEAKFYNNIENERLPRIINSVGNLLAPEKIRKENSIITNISDIDLLEIDSSLKEKIKEALSLNESLDDLKKKINIPILLLHECSITANVNLMTEEYKNEIKKYHLDRALNYFSIQFAKLKDIFNYFEIKFHLILFPVPCKDTIVKDFITNVEHYKGQ